MKTTMNRLEAEALPPTTLSVGAKRTPHSIPEPI